MSCILGKVNCNECTLVASWLANQSSNSVVQDRSPGGEDMDLLFNSDIVNLLLKTNGGRHRKPNFVIFVVWSAVIVDGWIVVAWSRKSCLGPAEISSFMFLV